jgi:hypothetical protein
LVAEGEPGEIPDLAEVVYLHRRQERYGGQCERGDLSNNCQGDAAPAPHDGQTQNY